MGYTLYEVGNCYISVNNKATDTSSQLLVTDVLISSNFPFHVFSEILAFEKHCTATKALGSWYFFSPQKQAQFHASQRLLQGLQGNSDSKLYFIDDDCGRDGQNACLPAIFPFWALQIDGASLNPTIAQLENAEVNCGVNFGDFGIAQPANSKNNFCTNRELNWRQVADLASALPTRPHDLFENQ